MLDGCPRGDDGRRGEHERERGRERQPNRPQATRGEPERARVHERDARAQPRGTAGPGRRQGGHAEPPFARRTDAASAATASPRGGSASHAAAPSPRPGRARRRRAARRRASRAPRAAPTRRRRPSPRGGAPVRGASAAPRRRLPAVRPARGRATTWRRAAPPRRPAAPRRRAGRARGGRRGRPRRLGQATSAPTATGCRRGLPLPPRMTVTAGQRVNVRRSSSRRSANRRPAGGGTRQDRRRDAPRHGRRAFRTRTPSSRRRGGTPAPRSGCGSCSARP